MKYPSHCVLVMGMSPDEGSLSSTSTCSKSAVGQLLSHWPSSDMAEGSRWVLCCMVLLYLSCISCHSA